MLDVGCGSGILAITAALLGANKIIGCDIDEVAVKVAGENAALNGVQDRIAFHQGDLTSQVEGSFQIICANIVADVIIRLSEDVGPLPCKGRHLHHLRHHRHPRGGHSCCLRAIRLYHSGAP